MTGRVKQIVAGMVLALLVLPAAYAEVQAFRDALEKSGTEWTMMEFGGVKHSFTNPVAGDYGLDALVYDKQADRQSWQMLLWLLDDTFN